MIDKRFYVIVPETVDTPVGPYSMEVGRVMAQTFHLGRTSEHKQQTCDEIYQDVTTIVLVVRNSKELDKVLKELTELQVQSNEEFPVNAYRDHNPPVYGTEDRILTAVGVGPVEKVMVDVAIGHLELY